MGRRFHINQDVLAGLMFVAFGGFFFYYGQEYQAGTAIRMGPGYMPDLLGLLLIGLGAGITIKGALQPGDALTAWALKPLIFVCGAFFFFSQSIQRLGLPLTAIITMICAAIAGPEFRLREQIILSLTVAVAATALFIWGLELPMRIWPRWLDFIFYG